MVALSLPGGGGSGASGGGHKNKAKPSTTVQASPGNKARATPVPRATPTTRTSASPLASVTTLAPDQVPGTYPVPEAELRKVEDVPLATLVAGAAAPPSGTTPPQALPSSNPALLSAGLPEVLYVGAEYCPYCAAERWVLVEALSKFGTFGPLRGTTSSSTDIYPSTPTFSFYHARYTSKYLVFVPVEAEANNGAPIQQLTAAQSKLVKDFDRPPYISASYAGSIPFIYLGGRYLQLGAQYEASAISATPMSQAVAYLTSGTNASSRGLEAAAGDLVGDICALTHGQPAAVCAHVPKALIGITTSSRHN